MELIILATSAAVIALAVWRAWEHLRVRRTLRALTAGRPALSSTSAVVSGHEAFGAWHFIVAPSDGDRSTERYERWRYCYTVQGILPHWLMMNWSAERSAHHRGTPDFLPIALFGADIVDEIPSGWTLVAEGGDLVVQTEERYRWKVPTRPQLDVDALGRRLALAHLARGRPALEQELRRQVEVGGQPEALRVYARHFLDAPGGREFVQDALRHEIAAVRVVAAQHAERGGVEVLTACLADGELPPKVRREAAHTLARLGEHAALLDAARFAPHDVEDILAEALGSADDDRVESALLPFLEHPQEPVVQAAAHALAQRGTGRSVGPLRARRARRASKDLRTALDVAVDLIQERVEQAQGGLALVPAYPQLRPETGRVSMLSEHQGRVSRPPGEADG